MLRATTHSEKATWTFSGRARVDARTKNLVLRLAPGEIAVVDHLDLDETAARALLKAGVRAVVNCRPFLSGRFPTPGPALLLTAGVPLVEVAGPFPVVEGDELTFDGEVLSANGQAPVKARLLTVHDVEDGIRRGQANLTSELSRFVENTLAYAEVEKDLVLTPLPDVGLATDMRGRPALVVVRGKNYREDLQAIAGYIRDVKPTLIGVDGGADALLEFGLHPDLIVGDMDSVSDRALRSGAELVVHAYPGGDAPGLARVQLAGLEAKVLPTRGVSEDVALLLAFEGGANLIVAVGTHLSMVEFLEKGREGMASTLLTRMKVGDILVDAKGVSRLYQSGIRWLHVAILAGVGLATIAYVLLTAPATQNLLRLFWIKIRYTLGL